MKFVYFANFLNSFKKLFGMIARPNALHAFNELIIKVNFLQMDLRDNLKSVNLV